MDNPGSYTYDNKNKIITSGEGSIVTNHLKVVGTLTINGSGTVWLGGQIKIAESSKRDAYSGLIAKNVVINGDGSVANLQIGAATIDSLTMNSGLARLHADGASHGNSYTVTNPVGTDSKLVQIKQSLNVHGGTINIGYESQAGQGTSQYQTYFHKNSQINQTGGTLTIAGQTFLAEGVTINQSGGTFETLPSLDSNKQKVDLEFALSKGTYNLNQTNPISGTSNPTFVVRRLASAIKTSGFGTHSPAAFNITQTADNGIISLTAGTSVTGGSSFTLTGVSTLTQNSEHGNIEFAGDFSNAPYNVTQTKGTVTLASLSKFKAEEAIIGGTLTLGSGAQFETKSLEITGNINILEGGKLVVGDTSAGSGSGGMTLKQDGKMKLLADSNTTAAITLNNGAMTVEAGATLEMNFTDAFLDELSDSDGDGGYKFEVLLASGASSATEDEAITLKTDCLTWDLAENSAVTLKKDATGNVYLTGELTKKTDTTVTVNGQDEVINKIEGAKKLVIETDTTISSDNTHTGGSEVNNANVVLNNKGALGDGDVTTTGNSSLKTTEGTVAELHATIENSGALTLGGDYCAEAGKLTAVDSGYATYICAEGEEGANGFKSDGQGIQVVDGGTVDVLPGTTLTVGSDKYIVSNEGNAWQLDTDKYYINEEAHDVAISDINGVRTTLGVTGTPSVDMKAGSLLVDEGEASVKASGGNILMKGDVTVDGELSGDTAVAVLEGETTLKGDNSHTGGTYIDGARLEIGGANALGEGIVYLENQGKLDLKSYAVQNDIVVTGCELHNALNYQGNLTVSGNLTICGTNANANVVTLSGAGNIQPSGTETLTVNSLVVAAGANHATQMAVDTTVTGSLVLNGGAVLTMGNHLTLADGSVIMLNGNYRKGALLVKLFDANDVDATGSVTLANGYGTYVVDGEWMILDGVFDQTIADAMVQANWGIPTASRAFVHAVRGQRTNTGCIADGRGTAWAAVLGAYNDLDGGDINLKGAAVGADMKVGSRSSVGMAIGYLDGEVSPTGLSDVDQEGTYVALYGEHELKKLSATSCLSADWVVAYGQTESKYNGMKWEQDSLQLNGRLSWNKQLSERLGLRVFGGLEYFTSDSDKVNGIDTGSIDNLRGELGVGVDYVAWGVPALEAKGAPLAGSGCKRLVLHGELRYFNDLDRENPVVEMDGMSGRGENPGRNGVGIDVGATYRINDRWSTSANYSYSTMDGSTEHRLNVGASYTF